MSDSALIDDLERQFAENPRRVFARLANEYRKAGDAEHAIEICLAHVPQQPGYISGHIVLGQALFDTTRFDEAKSAFETALGLDPENLIALRQLGDIARETGDRDDARSWYRRLLEVDPQNEEIAAQLSALDASAEATPDTPMPDGDAVPDQEPVSWGDIHPESVSPEPEPVAPDIAFHDVALEVEQAFPTMFVTDPASGTWEGDARHGALESELAAVESDELDVDEATVVGEEEPGAAPIAFERTTDESLEPLELPDVQLPDVPSLDTFVDAVSGSEPAPSWSDQAVDEERTAEATRPAVPASVDAPSADVIATPASNGAELPDAFVTETMADLYLQQGFHERALDVYRQLAQQYPDDSRFQEQIVALQDAVAAAQVETASSAAGVPDEAEDWSGAPVGHSAPTIRTFLSAIAARRATAAPSTWTPGSAPAGQAEDAEAVAAPSTASSSNEEPTAREEPSVHDESSAYGESLSYDAAPVREDVPMDHEPPLRDAASMDAAASDAPATEGLFPGWTVAPGHDAATGNTLADAYADDVHEGDGRDGMPAHRAVDELSLDAVFRESAGRERSRQEGSSVSFDEFFADDERGRHDLSPDASVENARGEAATSADLELFHAWLEGLKK